MQNGKNSVSSDHERTINPIVESFPALSEDSNVDETPKRFHLARTLSQDDSSSQLESTPLDEETQKDDWGVNGTESEASMASSPLFQTGPGHIVDLEDLAEQSPGANKNSHIHKDSKDRRSVVNQLRVLDGCVDDHVQFDLSDTQPVNKQMEPDDGNDTLIPTQVGIEFRTPVVHKFRPPVDEEDSTQPVNRPPPSSEKETRYVLNPPSTVVRNKPITQVLGTPYMNNVGSNSETTSTPTASGDKDSSSSYPTSKRPFNDIAEEDELTEEIEPFEPRKEAAPGPNDTITSDQEMYEHSLHSSGDIISSPDRSQQKRVKTNKNDKHNHKRRKSNNISTNDIQGTPHSRKLNGERGTPQLRKSPGFTPEHSRMRMPYFDEPGQTTPTKVRFASRTSSLSKQKENGVWLPWNDGKWWAVRVIQETPRGVAEMFESGEYSGDLLLIDSSDIETNAPFSVVKRLELFVGGKVKSRTNKKLNYEIVELFESSDPPSSDVMISKGGYDRVKLRSVGAKGKDVSEEIVTIDNLYMTNIQVRDYLEKREESKVLYMSDGHSTRLLDASLPERKSKTMTFAEPSSSLDTSDTNGNAAVFEKQSIDNQYKRGIFGKCAFALSSVDGNELSALKNAIVRNGGTICHNGLKDLFDVNIKDFSIDWQYTISHDRFAFAAVLSKGVLRTPKYLEAVALGWPCLSWRYVDDCVQSGKLLDWNPYLLAAGYSEVLDESPRSLDISYFNENYKTMHLRNQFDDRKKIMAGIKVPVYIIDRANHQEEAIKTLLLYMGIAKIKRAAFVQQVPQGSIVIDLSAKSSDRKNRQESDICSYTNDLNIIKDLTRGKIDKLSRTVHYSREWVIQCAINGRVI